MFHRFAQIEHIIDQNGQSLDLCLNMVDEGSVFSHFLETLQEDITVGENGV
ncbi:hypothetical protein GF407_16485 [candidate division KSB1 bacterium]|nr:hypothetical protein [candidate division KSB1 bacterium]